MIEATLPAVVPVPITAVPAKIAAGVSEATVASVTVSAVAFVPAVAFLMRTASATRSRPKFNPVRSAMATAKGP